MSDSGISQTYRELVDRSDRAAQALYRLGLQAGDTIAIFLENHLHYSEVCWAAKNSGIAYVCISTQLNFEDAAHVVLDSGAKLLVSSIAQSDIAVRIADNMPELLLIMLDGTQGRFLAYEALLNQESPIPLQNRHRGPSMLYSSGTTGRPKGIRTQWPDVPPETPPSRFHLLRQQYDFSPESVFINPGPFYHAGPLRFMMTVQRTGGTVIGFRKFDPASTLDTIGKYRVTHGLFVPTMFSRMLALPDDVRDHAQLGSIRFAIHAAAPCPVPVKELIFDWWGPVIYELYGGTESIGHTFITPEEWHSHKGSVGRAAAGCSIRILNEQGTDMPPGIPGKIYMANGNRFEYHNAPGHTTSAHLENDPSWASMGDIGYLDEDGYLYLTDRESFMIISGGVNIYPQEAENILRTHPAIADVAVIGVPNPDFGEEVKAIVQLSSAEFVHTGLEREIIEYCRSRLSSIKCPRSVAFVSNLPRSDMGKLLKHELKKIYWDGRDSQIV
ncbi:AMP-binding protein [Ferribacterium limneticum]|uniref:AMP-binding protein n=1 Tax=Ferribacterium limneticum TaxID=76259 RepID=UPI00384B0407|nr:AMP-binding protein [Ferribacterium limneticum]